MKVEIDFDKKIVTVEKQVNFKELMEFIQTLPEWEDYKLDTNTEIVWGRSPIIIREYPNPNYYTPWEIWRNPFTYNTNVSVGNPIKPLSNLQSTNANVEHTAIEGKQQFEIAY